jgi:glutamyl-tRNA reductase
VRPVVFGLNHTTAPLEVRERLAIPSERLPDALRVLSGTFGPAVVVSTCNRTEFYAVADGAAEPPAWEQVLGALYPMEPASIGRYFYLRRDMEAVRHLFHVAAGLDSMLVGETQVLGQVRSAFSASVAAGVARDPLSRLFHQALRVGKRVHTETRLSRNELSVSSACVRLARRAAGVLNDKSALVIGAGEAGKLAARALSQAGVGKLVIINRTLSRAQALAAELQASVESFESLSVALVRADLAVSATESPDMVVTVPLVAAAMRERPDRPLALMDIAMPRDVDPGVRSLPNVALYDLDDLRDIAEAHREDQRGEAARADAIVQEEVARFQAWWDGMDVVPTVAALRRQAEAVRQREMAKALKRLGALTSQQREVLDAMSRALVQRMLHDPIITLRSDRDPRHVQAIRALFRLPATDSDALNDSSPEEE